MKRKGYLLCLWCLNKLIKRQTALSKKNNKKLNYEILLVNNLGKNKISH